MNTLKHENKIILLWSVMVLLVVMNTTMFNVGLPTVLQDLSLASSTGSWIVSGYSIVLAIATLTFSRSSDFMPISRLLFIGVVLLGMASVLGWFADSFIELLFARLLQAAGAGAVPGLAMVLVGRYIPISRRGKAMSIVSSTASLGFGLGPVVGGVITQAFGWNYLFIVTSFTVLLLPIVYKLLPKEESHKVKFDFMGALLTALVVTCFLLFLSTFALYYLIISGVSLIILWNHIHKFAIPFIQPTILKKRPYIKLLLISNIAFIAHFSTLFMMPLMLANVFNKEAAMIGLMIFPGAILSAVAAQFIGRVIDRLGSRPIVLVGQTLLLISTSLFVLFSNLSPYWIMLAYVFMSVGFSALSSSIANEASQILPNEEIGTGMGMFQLVQFFGGALGVAVSGTLIDWQSSFAYEVIYRNIFIILIVCLLFSVALFISYRNGQGTTLAHQKVS
ncbi:MFS transporter [Mechercharimyces sp. CAU 1602]|uniref:MFS transporter n=1 Tax=Mechercharimyces sp. CAU 1602 TaxID=2973933 RepID=UPI0021622DE9|nr:MFS transporter [Mechercharimyces sp. CAU 1602]MCS1350274.1 MFS transporter [Mechercharimyces sp. CAU 1602]